MIEAMPNSWSEFLHRFGVLERAAGCDREPSDQAAGSRDQPDIIHMSCSTSGNHFIIAKIETCLILSTPISSSQNHQTCIRRREGTCIQ